MKHQQQRIIAATVYYVKDLLTGEGSGHDWWHIYRVWNNAKNIAAHEDVENYVVELAALLHDIGDHKFHNGDETVGPRMAKQWLEQHEVEDDIIHHICDIIKDLSFKGARNTYGSDGIKAVCILHHISFYGLHNRGCAGTFER